MLYVSIINLLAVTGMIKNRFCVSLYKHVVNALPVILWPTERMYLPLMKDGDH